MKLLFALAYMLTVVRLFTTFPPDEAGVRAAVLAVVYTIAYWIARALYTTITRIVRRN